MRWVKWFIAGAVAVPMFHQAALAVLDTIGFVDRAPFSLARTRPFGVPAVVSLSFWGGVWGPILGLVLRRVRGRAVWPVAFLFGAIAPTLVAGLVVAPLKGQAAGGDARMIITGLIVNGAWGLGAAALYRLMRGPGEA